MLTDVRYALKQLCLAREASLPHVRRDCLQRCEDALERLLEAAQAAEGGEPCESCGRAMGGAEELAPCEFAD